MSPVKDGTFVPAPDPQLDQALEYSHLVLELGLAGAPGAARILAELVPTLVVEILAGRAVRDRPADIAISEQLWRIRAKNAEKQVGHLGAAGEELLQQLSDERGMREALDRRVAELKRDVERERAAWDERGREIDRLNAKIDSLGARVLALNTERQMLLDPIVRQKMLESPPPLPLTADAAELLRLRERHLKLGEYVIGLEADKRHLEGQIGALAKVLLEEFGGPDRSESACDMAVRLLREQNLALRKKVLRIAELEQEACRYYRADGTYEVLPPAEVVERRILAARRLERLEELAAGGVAVAGVRGATA